MMLLSTDTCEFAKNLLKENFCLFCLYEEGVIKSCNKCPISQSLCRICGQEGHFANYCLKPRLKIKIHEFCNRCIFPHDLHKDGKVGFYCTIHVDKSTPMLDLFHYLIYNKGIEESHERILRAILDRWHNVQSKNVKQ